MYNMLLKIFYSYFPKPIKKLLKQVLPDRIVDKLSISKIQYEPGVCYIIENIVQPGWICADVGAHIGIVTLLLAKLFW